MTFKPMKKASIEEMYHLKALRLVTDNTDRVDSKNDVSTDFIAEL